MLYARDEKARIVKILLWTQVGAPTNVRAQLDPEYFWAPRGRDGRKLRPGTPPRILLPWRSAR